MERARCGHRNLILAAHSAGIGNATNRTVLSPYADAPLCGKRELVAVDARGNVAAFTPNATELWERHIGSNIAQARACILMRQGIVSVRLS